MSVLRRLNRPDVAIERSQISFNEWINLWHGAGSGGVSMASVSSLPTALSNSVVWRCAMKNAATVASWPVHTYRGREQITDPPIVANPAGDGSMQSSWVFASILSMYLRGGANFWLGPMGSTRAQFATLLHPDRVDWTTERGWTLDNDTVELWPLGPLYHVPLYVLPGCPKGLNPLQFAARSLFPGMAAQEFTGNFFRDGTHPSGIVGVEGDPGPDGARVIKERIMQSVSGTNREPLVLPKAVTWTQLTVDPKDSQFIETMKLSDEQTCRYMGTPPEEIGIAPSGASMTYANREQRKQDYLQELLWPKKQLEGAWSSLIARPQYVKLNPAGLLQADIKTRYETYKLSAEVQSLTGKPILTNDEIRDLEERDELPPGEFPDPAPTAGGAA
jgi:HK97 family phage portal protein